MNKMEAASSFMAMVDGSPFSLLVGKPLDANLGIEGTKYPGVDVRSLGLGFDVGFITVGDERTILHRYDNWAQMRQDGLSDFLVKQSALITLIDDSGTSQPAVITEDLTVQGWEIFEANQLYRNTVHLGPVTLEATAWLRTLMDKLNVSDCAENIKNLMPSLPHDVRDAFNWYAHDYAIVRNDKLPQYDPVVEFSLAELMKKMKQVGWTARTESLFVLTRRSQWGMQWPYERKVIIGDVGEGVYKGGVGGLDKKHLDQFYDVLDYLYAQTK